MNSLQSLIIVLICLVLAQSSTVFALARGHEDIAVVKYYNPKTGVTQPFFSFGWYVDNGIAPGTPEWDLIAQSNANMVHLVNLRSGSALGTFLDNADKDGFKVIPCLHTELLKDVDSTKPETYARIKKMVTAHKDHPALLGWKMGDELEGEAVKDVLESAKVIHKLDPDRQVWQVFCGIHLNNWERVIPYVPGTDVASFGQYFELNDRKTFGGCDPTLYHVTNDTALGSHLKIACTLGVQAMGGDKHVLKQYRFPTHEEFRWNIFSGLTSGARGIDLFILPERGKIDAWYTNLNDFYDFVKNTVGSVFGELKQIKYAMETGYNVGEAEITWDGKYEELKLWDKNFEIMSQLLIYDAKKKCYFLIVTNHTSKDREFEITLSQLPVKLSNPKAVIMQTGKTVTLKKTCNDSYQLKDTIGDHGVKLYRLSSN